MAGVVNLRAKSILHSAQIGFVAIRGQLDAKGAALEIVHEVVRRTGIAGANKPARNKFRGRANRNPSPDTAVAKFVDFVIWQVGVFRVTEAPNLIALNLGAFQVAQLFILILSARAAKIDQQLHNRATMHAGHALQFLSHSFELACDTGNGGWRF